MTVVRESLAFVLNLYFLVLIARLVFDWIQMFAREWRPRGIVLIVAEGVYSLTDPPLRAVRRVIPPIRLGSVSLDLGFLVVALAVSFAANLLG